MTEEKAPPPRFDSKRRAMIQEKVHLLPENKAEAVKKEDLDANIRVLRDHIASEEQRRDELLELIEEGLERDKKLNTLGF